MPLKVPNGVSEAPIVNDIHSYDYYSDFEAYLKDNPMNLDIDESKIITRFKPNFNPTKIDHIIDPYEYALEYLGDTSAEGRAKYLHYLEQGKYIQQMQMVAFENWYNSPEQQVKRQRSAGLNPDLLGVENTPSASGAAPDGSGISGLPTQEAIDAQKAAIEAQKIQNIATIVSSIANVAGLASNFANLTFLKPQKQILENQAEQGTLQNIAAAEAIYSKGISGRLASAIASAGDSFDASAWFADDSNFEGLYDAYTASPSPQMKAIFDNLRSRGQEGLMSQALAINKSRADTQTGYASIIGSSQYSDDVKVQAMYLKPLNDAKYKLEEALTAYQTKLVSYDKDYLDNLSAFKAAAAKNAEYDALTAENQYKSEYFGALEGKKVAAYEELLRSVDSIKKQCQSEIYGNFKTAITDSPYSPLGLAASYMSLDNSHIQFTEWLIASGVNGLGELLSTSPTSSPSSPDVSPSPFIPRSGFTHFGSDFYQFPNGMNFGN